MRTDYEILQFLKRTILKHFPSTIKEVIISSEEDYKFDMTLVDFKDIHYPVEVKTSMHHQLRFNDHWNNFFQLPAGKGLWKTSTWEGNLSHAYCLNASTKIGGKHIEGHPNCKWEKMKSTPNSMFIFMSIDGMITYTHQQLMTSFLGYTTITCNHSTFFNDKTQGEELKSIISLDGGNYYRFSEQERSEITEIFINNMYE